MLARPEGAALRMASAARSEAANVTGPVWVKVAGELIAAPDDEETMRVDWLEEVVDAVCTKAYDEEAQRPAACRRALLV